MKKDEMKVIKDAFLKNIGAVIQKHRKQKKMTHESLGKELGLSHSTIDRYESGTTDIPASRMAYISSILEFPLQEYVQDANSTAIPCEEAIPFDTVIRNLIEIVQANKAKKELKPENTPTVSTLSDDIHKEIEITEYEHKINMDYENRRADLYVKVNEKDSILVEYMPYKVPVEKQQSVRRIYETIAEQMPRAKGSDIEKLASIARSTLDYAINDLES